MRRLTTLLTILTFTGIMLAACGGDSGTGPDPDNNNEGNGGEETTTYTVDVSAADGGSVSPSGANEYNDGETAELTAEPNDEYLFTHWSGDIDSTADNPLSLTVAQDYSLAANFEKKTYALTTNTEGDGAIDEKVVQEKSTDYESGTVVELTANPADGYKFVEWKGDLTGTENPRQITVDNPKEVIAVFEKKSYALTTNIEGEGAVYETVIQQKTTDFDYGTVVELEANPSTGWEFTGWQGDLTGSRSPEQITVTQSATITAEFELLDESSRPAFYLAENGVTVKCEDASVGDKGTVDGVEYTKRSGDQITTGNAPTTCTSGITNMTSLFNGATNFNGDLSHWDVGSVEYMGAMFNGASSFNQDLKSWDVSSVTLMGGMFKGASSFNQDLSHWDVSGVEYTSEMFAFAGSFNGDISNWDVSSVTSMVGMFWEATAFNGDLSLWDVSSVTDMNSMFEGATTFNGDISSWDVSGVENMSQMFREATNFNGDISGWNVSDVTDMRETFYLAESFNQNTGSWDVSSVTNMHQMFFHAKSFDRDISSWDVSSVTDMYQMFFYAESFNQDISDWSVPRICSEPFNFDIGTHEEFEDNANKQPNWSDTCK